MDTLLRDFLDHLGQASTLLELLVVVVLLALAAWISRRLRQRAGDGGGMHTGGLKRIAFPLIGIAFLALLRFVGHHNGLRLAAAGVAIQLLVALAAVRIAVFALHRAFKDSLWVASFERSLVTLIWAGVALDIIGILPELIDWLDSFALHIGKVRVTLWEILQGAVSVVATLIVALWMGGLIEGRLMQSSVIDTSFKVVLTRLSKAILIMVAVLVGMSLVGLDITTLSVFGGALGVGLGFGMQKIASNYVSGFIILLDNSIRIGNVIQVGQDKGEVKQITTRYTVLRSGSGTHVLVPNETLVSSTVHNETFGDRRQRIALKVQISYRSDVEKALAILAELATAHECVLADPAPTAFVLSLDENGVTMELGVWIAEPSVAGETRSRLNLGILRRFAAESVEVSSPQREVRLVAESTS